VHGVYLGKVALKGAADLDAALVHLRQVLCEGSDYKKTPKRVLVSFNEYITATVASPNRAQRRRRGGGGCR
jgi:hypothetical protein